jgi:hypothetical protein
MIYLVRPWARDSTNYDFLGDNLEDSDRYGVPTGGPGLVLVFVGASPVQVCARPQGFGL